MTWSPSLDGHLHADHHGFLADVEVAEPADQSHAVKLARTLLEAADQQHVAVGLKLLVAAEGRQPLSEPLGRAMRVFDPRSGVPLKPYRKPPAKARRARLIRPPPRGDGSLSPAGAFCVGARLDWQQANRTMPREPRRAPGLPFQHAGRSSRRLRAALHTMLMDEKDYTYRQHAIPGAAVAHRSAHRARSTQNLGSACPDGGRGQRLRASR